MHKIDQASRQAAIVTSYKVVKVPTATLQHEHVKAHRLSMLSGRHLDALFAMRDLMHAVEHVLL